MPGIVYRAVPRQTFDFKHVAAAANETRCTAPMISTAEWTQATLIVRVYNLGIAQSDASIAIRVVVNATNDEDASSYLVTTAITGGEITITSATTAAVQVSLLTGPIGAAVAVFVVGTQGAQNGNLFIDCSADLVLKS